MKLKHLVPIIPIVVALTGCGQTELNLKNAADVTGTALTATPVQLVVYPDDRPSIPDGKPLYMQNCASCHGAEGAGGSAGATNTANAAGATNATAGANPPATSTATSTRSGGAATTAQGQAGGNQPGATASGAAPKFDLIWSATTKPIDIYRKIAFGGKNHPAFVNKLSPRELWNIVVYAKNLGQPALTDEQLAAIDPVFGSNCAVCHGTKGDGEGPLAHNLEPMPANFQRFDRFFNRSDDVLFDHIANGIRWEGMPNFLGKQDRKKNVKFDEAYIKQLVQYVHKFHVNNAPVLTASAETTTGTATNTATNTGASTTTKGTAQNTAAAKPRRKHR